MYLNLFLVSFSVFYSKFNYCYEVPENMPLRYFDGTVWKIMKSREQIRIVPTHANLSIELDWLEFSQENNKTEQLRSACVVASTTSQKKIFRATTKRITTKKVTKKVTKIVPRKGTTKATTKRCSPCDPKCNLKKITTHKSVPRAITQTTKKPNLRTTWKPPAKTVKKFVRTTKKPAKKPSAKPLAILAKKYIANSKATKNSINGQQALPEDWLSTIKDLVDALKIVEEKKNKTQCGTECSPQLNPQYPLVDGRRSMDGMNDIMDLLMDGVEIDDNPDVLFRNDSDDGILPGYRGLPEDQDIILDINEMETLFASNNLSSMENKNPTLNENNLQNLDLESIKDAIKTRYANGDDKSLPNEEIKEYFDLLKSRYAKKDSLQVNEVPLNLAAINAVIETKHPENPEFREVAELKDNFKESDLKTYLGAKKFGNLQNKAIKAYYDLLKFTHVTNNTSQIGDISLDLDALDPVIETHNFTNPEFRELVEYSDTQNKKQEIVLDEFQGIDLSPYLNAMDTRDTTKSEYSLQNTYGTIDKDNPETKLLNLDELAALINSKATFKQTKHKKSAEESDLKSFLNDMTRLYFARDKAKSHIRNVTVESNEIVTKEEYDINALENVEENKQNYDIDIDLEENGLSIHDNDEQKETDTKEKELEDDLPVHNLFKYMLDDGDQNETREDTAFTWDDGGEIFVRPETRATLAS